MNNTKSKSVGRQLSDLQGAVIKIGIDVHLFKYVAVRIIEGRSPERARRFGSQAELVEWIGSMVQAGATVHSCYEAGPLGYVLHRQLEAIGVRSLVVRPYNCDKYAKRVKTDKRDATELAQALDRWVHGNTETLTVLRVPTEKEERDRAEARQIKQLRRHILRVAAQGRSLALQFGFQLEKCWWRKLGWKIAEQELPGWLIEQLAVLREILLTLDPLNKQVTKKLEEQAPKQLPTRVGALTWILLLREVCDWSRFKNRQQVPSYMGLVPSEHSTGSRRLQGSINKHGNPAMRCLLIQAAWRLWTHQPDYRPVRLWRERLAKGGCSPGRRKKAMVAIARQLAIDLWRLNTGQSTAEKLGLKMA